MSWRAGERMVLEKSDFCALPGEITGVLGVNGSGNRCSLLAGCSPAAGGRFGCAPNYRVFRAGARAASPSRAIRPGAFALPVKESGIVGAPGLSAAGAVSAPKIARLAGATMEGVASATWPDRDWQRLCRRNNSGCIWRARWRSKRRGCWMRARQPSGYRPSAAVWPAAAAAASVVVTPHDLNLAACYCDRVGAVAAGAGSVRRARRGRR
ncbi:ABC transporter ATP-binding protein [Serratia ureilytica]